ncbi:MAG TPA: cation diffusion facilitator family transporter [Caulobacteraceae bacterium]|nr:cation diffusion facilitator family transporter [Caulobacteraceae bacterium]
MADGSRVSIYSALLGNLAVAAVKFGAFAVGGSSAMLTEGVHSVVDSVNQLLLLYGMRRGERAPDEEHPFGYGMEVYFWTFVVSLLIFALGGAVAIYQGVLKFLHPTPVDHAPFAMAVIAVSAVFEIGSLMVSRRAAEKTRSAIARRSFPRLSLVRAIHISKDPGVFEVIAEGVAAIIGLVMAAAGVAASAWLGWTWADGAASIAIGLLLAVLAFILGAETRSLLTGEAAAGPVIDEVRAILDADKRVRSVASVQSMHLGPEQILVAVTLKFQDSLTGPQLEEAADELTDRLEAADRRITRLFLRPCAIVD